MKITLCGGGSWGTAIARLLSNKGHDVNFYIRNKSVIYDIKKNKENSKYLPGAKFENEINLTNNLLSVLKDIDIFVLAVPTTSSREILEEIKNYLGENVIIVNLSKGFEVDTLKRISEISKEILPRNPFVALSGPSHAEEVGKDIPTTVVASSENLDASKIIQREFSTPIFRIYTNSDLIGVEIGGALKNIIALAAGMNDGLNYGDNSKAALMTRGVYEMSKLGITLGANPHTFNGLSGIGDLIVTCTSMHSRNRRAGILIGKGMSMQDACKEVGQVVEGVKTVESTYKLSKIYNIEMPITKVLYEILYKNYDPRKAVYELMTRKNKDEIEQIFFE
ncbi:MULTISPECIES: NAD(P)H-dependent glycerol-3-phosphate dehydrogenase [Peptoniphilus]|jgi:glycerol-3-phosphate dehydrogenase [NAD(P)+]|uniref:NAD(P)H-dependent glycerol-3-phosphate dehydrogenase n=2 Tax=Peptoniphilaceae TaxID=1570339 RepID=UPI00028962D3|nr:MULTISPECIES: NAD(P)H-dependent glycerol-3-phosphate dehydrogenase [Peptoniphilus]MBS6610024.1 NAD(P)H-dependent glycerol-3-phosphate dehydrogenase [Peptoniphilus harei]MDU1043485.1 NAD(P)H-dependent glycerol-3-phosphate dehydrogenase [Peptoniphilus rhinitidis]MDU3751097.1 NAD(P)H-dependent glycerol-3-phosphate dehydrogenase [Peptoniphilus rhinitidis]MDU5376827.1 NAD(P)H-dependent glycerol-3-phosphate dehydrogenase [Peptoniphilus lacydonensis]MDU5436460.1 NAD(P)H-dependent glycerol-3-phosph